MECGAGRGRVMDVDVDTCALDCGVHNIEKEKYSTAFTCHERLDGPGRFSLFRCRLLSSVSLAVVVTALAAFDAGLSPSLAQCMPPPGNYGFPGVNANCTGSFNSNINYNTADGLGGFPINLMLAPGVTVTSPGGNAVNTITPGA
jgi:hypothetical protein